MTFSEHQSTKSSHLCHVTRIMPGFCSAFNAWVVVPQPELEQVNGFVDNIRYRSLTREGWPAASYAIGAATDFCENP